MQEFLAMIYLWLKAGHIAFVIFWIAGLFMLPRFFVYHQEAPEDSAENAKWIEREQRLLKIILAPSIVAVWVFGLALAWVTGAFVEGWFHLKLLLVILLSGYHGWLSAYAKKLARGERSLGEKTLRLLNEVPGIATILIVITVIVLRTVLA